MNLRGVSKRSTALPTARLKHGILQELTYLGNMFGAESDNEKVVNC